MHTLLKKTISILVIMWLFFSLFSNAITPLSQVFAAEVCTTKIVQWWNVDTLAFTNARFKLSYNGSYWMDDDFISLNDIIKDANTIFQQHHEKDWTPLYSFAVQDNLIYIVDSDNNPLDSKKDIIEIQLYNYDTDTDSIIDKENTDGGYNEGLSYWNIEMKDCKQDTTCGTVQWWTLNGNDFSNMVANVYFNGDSIIGNTSFSSIEEFITSTNNNFSKHHDKTWAPLINLSIEKNILYITDSNNNPLDNKKDMIEIIVHDKNSDTYIIEDKAESDGGYNAGLLYSDQKIDCATPPTDECTTQTMQWWELTQTDFSNMEIIAQHNGIDFLKNTWYTSIELLISDINKAYSESATKWEFDNKEFIYDKTTNRIYIKDSDRSRLDPKSTMIEILLINRNDDSLLIDKSNIDGGNFEWLVYSDIQICINVTEEETCSSTKNVQWWLLNGNDFSNISLYASYNGKDIKTDVFSQKELLDFLNNDFIKSASLSHTFKIIDNILYIVGSDETPLMTDKEFIEINMFNNIDKIDIISTSEKDGWISRGLLYSNQNISDCNPETPTELDIPEFVCSHKMKWFDIALYSMNWDPSYVYFHWVEDESTIEKGNYVNTPISQINNAEIQTFLNSIYGENKVIRYFNEDDNTVTVRYDSEIINPKSMYILMGDSKSFSNKLDSTQETTHNLCSIDKPLEVEIIQKATCTPNLVTSSDQKIVCEFTVTNQWPWIAYDMTYNWIKLPNGFKIIDQWFPDVTSMDIGDSLTYKFIWTQSILPKSWSEVITIGDLDLTYYDNTKTDYNISMSTTIELKRSSRGNSSSSSSSNSAITEPIKTNPVIIPTNTTTWSNNQSTWAIVSSWTVTSTGVTHNTGSANNIIVIDNPTTGTINTWNNKPVITEPIKEEIIQEIPIMELTQYCAYETPIPTNAWQDINTEYANDIKHLISKCIVNGLDNEMLYYGPHKVIKKAEVVKIVSKWFKLSIPKSTSDNRWEQYLSSMQVNKALVWLEDTRNESTMNEWVKWDDVITILKNINPDANLDLIKSFSTKRVSRQAFAHIITRQ